MSLRCYDPSKKFKPEWAYTPIPGKRQESFILPFSFSVPANGAIQPGYGWKLDDDTTWIWRAILFPQIGTAEAVNQGTTPYVGNPGLVRIRDSHGNPLTNCIAPANNPAISDMVLAAGVFGQSGFDQINAGGFPLGCEIVCEPGGVITFDFLIPNVSGGAVVNVQMQGTMIGVKLFDDC